MSFIRDKPLNQYAFWMRIIFWFQKRKYGKILEPTLLWGRTPRAYFYFLKLFKALNRKSSPIEPLLRALVTVKISQINHCDFCVDLNSYFVLEQGGRQEKLQALGTYQTSDLFSNKEKIALLYAEKITQSSGDIPESIFTQLKQHFSEDAIVDLTALIAFQNCSSKFNAALGAKAFGFCQK